MALFRGKWAKRQKQLPHSREACGVVTERFEFDLSELGGVALQAGDVIELAGLPARHTVTDYILDNGDLDTNGTPTLDVDIGIMTGEFGEDDAARTAGAEFFDDSTALQDPGLVRGSNSAGFRIDPADNDRGIGVLINVAPATQPANGVIALILSTKQ
jgi:hypothetical protein